MTRSFTCLVHPASDGGADPGAVVPLTRLLRAAGARVEVTYSPGPRAVRTLATEAVGRGDVVVSVGGDGLLSSLAEVVGGLGGTLGVVPARRDGGVARRLALPSDPEAVAAVLLHGSPRTVDLLGVGGRLVVGSVHAGIPPPRRHPLAAVRALASYAPAHYRLVVDGTVHELSAATVVVSGSDEGLLDVVVVEAVSRVALVRALRSGHGSSLVLRGRRVEVSADAREPVPVRAGGVPLGHLPALAEGPLVVEVVPGALSVLA